jgi:hypothetical protein
VTSTPHDVRTYVPAAEISDDKLGLGDLIGVGCSFRPLFSYGMSARLESVIICGN